jgi:hypothetical protein
MKACSFGDPKQENIVQKKTKKNDPEENSSGSKNRSRKVLEKIA